MDVHVTISNYSISIIPLDTNHSTHNKKLSSDDTGGSYFKSLDEQTLNEILSNLSFNMEYETELSTIRDWFIGAAICFLLLDVYIIYGRYRIVAW